MGEIKVLNYDVANGITIGYPLLYIHGSVQTTDDLQNIVCYNGEEQNWPIIDGEFKCFCFVRLGINDVLLKLNDQSKLTIQVKYEKQKCQRHVRPIYIICKDSDGSCHGPLESNNTLDTVLNKIKFNCYLIQTYFAESIFEHFSTRKTFNYKENEDEEPSIEVFHSDLNINQVKQMNGDDLYKYFHKELTKKFDKDSNSKYLVFMSCTRYLPPTNIEEFDVKKATSLDYIKGHAALGGGNMALFGTGSLFSWARDLTELNQCFNDQSVIDKQKLIDDSGGRGTYGASYSTTLGAVVHELGHAFDLSHTPHGIMSRGFDDMNYFFTVVKNEGTDETCKKKKDKSLTTLNNIKEVNNHGKYKGAHWYRSSAVILYHNKWFNNVLPTSTLPGSFTISLHPNLLGPLGNNTEQFQSNQLEFNSKEWLTTNQLTLTGIVFYYDDYLYGMQFVGVKQEIKDGEVICRGEETKSKICGSNPSNATDSKIYFFGSKEKIEKVKLRSGSWIDGIQLFTNLQSSKWMGGEGGDSYELNIPCNQSIDAWVITGESYIGSITLKLQNTTQTNQNKLVPSISDKNFFSITSINNIVIIEFQKENGEICYYKEHDATTEPLTSIKVPWKSIIKNPVIGNRINGMVYDELGEKYMFAYSKDELEKLFKMALD